MSTKAKNRLCSDITRHGEALLSAYPHATIQDPVKLCKALRKVETVAHRFSEQLCNGPELTEQQQNNTTIKCLMRVNKLLGPGPRVFLNRDPRGYALKIEEADACLILGLHRDWGGYGILAPDFRV